MKRKIIVVTTVFCMLLSLFSTNVSAVQSEYLSGGELLKQYVVQNDVNDEMLVVTEQTALDKANINAEYLQSYIDGYEAARKTYGGCYIDDDGILHVLFTDRVESDVIESVNIMTENGVIIESCKYTLDELESLKELISGVMANNALEGEISRIANDIIGAGLYQKQNKVFVQIKNCTKEKIALFQKLISNSDAIVFETSNGNIKCLTTLKCGWGIAISTSTGYWGYSIGFRCKRLKANGSYAFGFMTAAHGNYAGDDVYNSSGTKRIGYVMGWNYFNNGKVDAAFVCITSDNYEMSNTIRSNGGALVAGSYVTTYPEGNTVYMAGSVSELKSGKIISSSAVAEGVPGDPVTVRDCVIANYTAQEGDSGGLVYIKQNGSKYIAGINMAQYWLDDVNSGTYFVKVKNIKEVFDIVIY